MDTLESFGAGIDVPGPSADRSIVFRPETFGDLPTELVADELVARVGAHVYYPDFTLHATTFYGSRRALRALGLLLVARVFRPDPAHVRVHLASRARAFLEAAESEPLLPEVLLVSPPDELDDRSSPSLAVRSYTHWSKSARYHPWYDELPKDPIDLPALNVTTLDGGAGGHRDQDRALLGFGNLRGTLRMASLLLDFASTESTLDEIVLEGEPGFRGVAPTSHEIRLCVPGSDPWVCAPEFLAHPSDR